MYTGKAPMHAALMRAPNWAVYLFIAVVSIFRFTTALYPSADDDVITSPYNWYSLICVVCFYLALFNLFLLFFSCKTVCLH